MNGYIVCYQLKTRGNSKEIYTDHFQVFIDNEKQALDRYNYLLQGGEFTDKVEVYSVNLCKIIQSSEVHY